MTPSASKLEAKIPIDDIDVTVVSILLKKIRVPSFIFIFNNFIRIININIIILDYRILLYLFSQCCLFLTSQTSHTFSSKQLVLLPKLQVTTVCHSSLVLFPQTKNLNLNFEELCFLSLFRCVFDSHFSLMSSLCCSWICRVDNLNSD